jgi:hypothetical protein
MKNEPKTAPAASGCNLTEDAAKVLTKNTRFCNAREAANRRVFFVQIRGEFHVSYSMGCLQKPHDFVTRAKPQ